MNKNELIIATADRVGMSKKDVEAVVNAALNVTAEALGEGEKVQLIGFGTFEVRARKEHSGRNPKTGEEITIPASKAPVFKPGKALKENVAK